jgi:hypothetical protein
MYEFGYESHNFVLIICVAFGFTQKCSLCHTTTQNKFSAVFAPFQEISNYTGDAPSEKSINKLNDTIFNMPLQ